MTITRINKTGRQYYLVTMPGGRTLISTHDKEIIVGHTIEELSQSWYDWMITGLNIQTAFKYLSDDEREFILTGITSDEWNEMWKENKETE